MGLVKSYSHSKEIPLLLSLSLILAGHYVAMAYQADRPGPTGRPNPAEPPETPPPPKPKDLKFKRLTLSITGRLDEIPETAHDSHINSGVFDAKRLVPSGPNAQQSPDAPSFGGMKRLVPSGPNAQESPDSPPKHESFEAASYSQSNGFEQSPPGF